MYTPRWRRLRDTDGPAAGDGAGPPDAVRACGRDDEQGTIAAKFVLDRFKDKKMAIVDDKSTAGKGLADEMQKAFNAGGGKEALREGKVGEKDFSALVSKIKEAGADLVYYGSQRTEAGLIVRQMKDQGVTAVLMGGDGISNRSLARSAVMPLPAP